MKIAILAWGSETWDLRDVHTVASGWHFDGPLLPIEFARTSDPSEPLPRPRRWQRGRRLRGCARAYVLAQISVISAQPRRSGTPGYGSSRRSGWIIAIRPGPSNLSPALLALGIQLVVPESERWKDAVKQGAGHPVREIFSGGLLRTTILAIAFASVALIGTWASVHDEEWAISGTTRLTHRWYPTCTTLWGGGILVTAGWCLGAGANPAGTTGRVGGQPAPRRGRGGGARLGDLLRGGP